MIRFNVETSARFKKAYDKLPRQIQKRTKRVINLLRENLKHPSIRAKKISGSKNVWEGRITNFYRFTFQIENSTILLRNIGRHDETLKSP